MIKKVLICFCLVVLSGFNKAATKVTPAAEMICGKWMSSDKDIIVQVYRESNTYKGKIVWFQNTDTSKAMHEWTDKHNPNPSLRNRTILGMNVVEDLVYVPKTNSWENGTIYDARSGRKWSSSAYIDSQGVLKVTGYWQFKFIGKTLTFKKV